MRASSHQDCPESVAADPGAGAPAEQVVFRWARENGIRTLAVVGEIDLAVESALTEQFDELVGQAGPIAYVDLSGVTFMDSTGLRVLVRSRNAGRTVGTDVRLSSVSVPVRRVLELSGLWDSFGHGG